MIILSISVGKKCMCKFNCKYLFAWIKSWQKNQLYLRAIYRCV